MAMGWDAKQGIGFLNPPFHISFLILPPAKENRAALCDLILLACCVIIRNSSSSSSIASFVKTEGESKRVALFFQLLLLMWKLSLLLLLLLLLLFLSWGNCKFCFILSVLFHVFTFPFFSLSTRKKTCFSFLLGGLHIKCTAAFFSPADMLYFCWRWKPCRVWCCCGYVAFFMREQMLLLRENGFTFLLHPYIFFRGNSVSAWVVFVVFVLIFLFSHYTHLLIPTPLKRQEKESIEDISTFRVSFFPAG